MNNKSILALMLVAGCNGGEVVAGDINIGTSDDGGYGESGGSGDTEGVSNPDECWAQGAPAGSVRWQCEGLAEATVFATLDIDVPDIIENAEFIQQVIDAGRWDFARMFGPWNDEDYDDPGVDACCAPDIVGAGEEAADETGADPGDEESIPQAAQACADDCADQACRSIPGTLRSLADQIPAGIPVVGPSYRNQLRDLADWAAGHNQDCWIAMTDDDVDLRAGSYIIHGEWQLPNSNKWPDVTDLSVQGTCKVRNWYLPEDGEPQACTGINDNNDEVPSGSGGALGGFDTFSPTYGEMHLDGPTVFGVDADGSAPILGLGDACPRGECSRLDAWVTRDTLELRRMVVVAPPTMSWERDGMRLTIDGMHAVVEDPMSIPLVGDGDSLRFEIPAGELEVLFAGRIHGAPVKVELPNATPVTGVVFTLFDGSHGIAVDPFTVEHHDAFGTWTMRVELGELVGVDHAPRATFDVQGDGSTQRLDASASFDPDGDALIFEWYRDGTLVGEGPVMESEPAADGATPTLVVIDETGRTTSSNGLTPEGR